MSARIDSAGASIGSPVVAGSGTATDYARALLGDLGIATRSADGPRDPHPAIAWARSGAMALCGREAEAPRLAGTLASCADGVARALTALGAAPPADAPALLGERAALFGHRRRGNVSPGGSCRLLPARDGWLAVNLAREADRAALPAWLECAPVDVPAECEPTEPPAVWDFVARAVSTRDVASLAERAALLGMPCAIATAPGPGRSWLRVAVRGEPAPRKGRAPRVVDFSALWAGPLCTSLLADAGAEVIKVESHTRPDAARSGSPVFFDLLNGGKRSVALDFGDRSDRGLLDALVESADVVVESTRPRALAQLGLDAEAFVKDQPGRIWLSLTGYGRGDPAPGRAAFGDDAAVAAGLARAVADERGPLFCGDAIADPLTGLHAALAVWASWQCGESVLLDLALRDVSAHAFGFAAAGDAKVTWDGHAAEVAAGAARAPVAPPRARPVARMAVPLGHDTEAVRRELAAHC